MNYRHAYHAGNFADVLKHACWRACSIISGARRRRSASSIPMPAPGAMRSPRRRPARPANGTAASRRLIGPEAKPLPPGGAASCEPYLDAVRAENGRAASTHYPGSPAIALRLMRAQDVLIANELHPEDVRAEGRPRARPRAKVMALDGWVALKALLPPKERRGVVLIDPPFEEPGELERIAAGLAQALQRFATGTYLAWYPIKDPQPIRRFHTRRPPRGAEHAARRVADPARPSTPTASTAAGSSSSIPLTRWRRDLAVVLPELAPPVAAVGGGAELPSGLDRNPRTRSTAGGRRYETAVCVEPVKASANLPCAGLSITDTPCSSGGLTDPAETAETVQR